MKPGTERQISHYLTYIQKQKEKIYLMKNELCLLEAKICRLMGKERILNTGFNILVRKDKLEWSISRNNYYNK